MIPSRECYKCGQLIYYTSFMDINTIRCVCTIVEKMLDPILLHQIWINPMFLLECCWCFKGHISPHAFRKLTDKYSKERRKIK